MHIGQRKIEAYRAKLKLIDDLTLSKEIKDKALEDGQRMGAAILWAEAKMGELLPTVTKNYQSSGRGTLIQPSLPDGITKKQSHQAQELSKNKDLIEETIREAEKSEDWPNEQTGSPGEMMDIIEFIEDKKLINDKSLSVPQKVALKADYGLPLDKKEKGIYRKCSGEAGYYPKEYREALFVCGRRAGKSDKIASNIALYEATCRNHKFSVGEEGFVVLVARDKRQARVLYKYCLGKLQASPILSKMITNITAEEIELNNGVRIAIYPCSVGAIRGIAPVCFIGDEAAFWKVEGRADVDKEVINSIRPGLAQFEKSKLILISTPYAKRGLVWEDYRKNYGQRSDTLVFQASTEFLNPCMRSSIIKKELEKDYAAASSEYLARFRQDLEAYVSQEIVEACVIPGRGMLPRVANVQYYAFADPSGGRGDSFTLAIAHKRGSTKTVVIDRLEEKKPPFKPKEVVREFSKIMRSYGISKVMGDKYAGEWVSAEFREANIDYESSERNKSELYLELLPMLTQGTVELPDHPKMIGQITGLERRTRSSGKDLVDHFPGAHDDICNVIAGVVKAIETRKEFGFGVMGIDIDDDERGLEKSPGWVKRLERDLNIGE